MAISNITQEPQTLTPAYNPIKFDFTHTTPNWVYMNYVLFSFGDFGVSLPTIEFKKSNVYNSTYSTLDFTATLQDLMTLQNPIITNTISLTGKGWIRRFYGVVYDNTLPLTYYFFPQYDLGLGQKTIWSFNGSLRRDVFLSYKASDLIPNSFTDGGKFLSDFNNRTIRFESTSTIDVINGQFESDNKNLNDTEYEYTNYHNISYSNDNSEGLFNNNTLRIVDNKMGVRFMTFFIFFGEVEKKLAAGDIVNYSTYPLSDVFANYGSSLDGEYTISSLEELSIDPTTSIYSVNVKIDKSIPTTFSLIGNDNMYDIGTVQLVERKWSLYNRYYESSRYRPRSYVNENVDLSINYSSINKKLTIPSGPINLRQSMGKRYIDNESTIIGGITYCGLVLDEPHNYEIGDEIIHFPQAFVANVSSIKTYGKHTIIDIVDNKIVIDLLYSDFPNPNAQGVIWSHIKDGLLKSCRKVIKNVSISTNIGTNNLEFFTIAENLVGLPDKFLITIKSSDIPFSIPNEHLIDEVFVPSVGVIDSDTIITFKSRTYTPDIEGLTAGEISDLQANTYTADIVVHHHIASNKGYADIFGYDGSFTDEYYNNPVNSTLDSYTIGLERIEEYDSVINVGQNLNYTLNKKCSKYDLVDIVWVNNYGVYDSFTFDWKQVNSREYKRNIIRKSPGSFNGTFNYSNLDRELTDYQITTDFLGNLASDWVNEAEYNRLLEILDSPVIYMYKNGDFTPIVIEIDEIIERTVKNDKIFNINLNFRVSFNKKSIRI